MSPRVVSLQVKSVALLLFGWLMFAPASIADAQKPTKEAPPKNAKLTLDRLFTAKDFDAEGAPRIAWQKGGRYTILADKEIHRYDPATGAKEVLVPAHWLVPPSDNKPLAVEDYEFSDDGSRLLIYTNSKRVWRVNSRGDYWVLDLSNRELKKLGGDAPASTLMFAKFSPDGRRVAYVRDHDLYAQNLGDLRITRLTKTGSPTIINGTFDWVYEEELGLRNGFRWSDDSQSIAFWEINTDGVPEFYLLRTSDGPYSKVIPIRYPKTGERNPAARIGVVSADGGEPVWADISGDPREHYLAHLEWLGPNLVVQQFNRLQNWNRVLTVDPVRGDAVEVFVERDEAWVENNNDFRTINNRKQFVWLSERDGWRHVYLISSDGKQVTPLTTGKFDVVRIDAVDEPNGWLYYTASPDNPTQRYLYRVPLKGGDPQRVSPSGQPGTHGYAISPDAQWAIHTYSTINTPPAISLIRLPEHKSVKTFTDNAKLKDKLAALKKCPTELFRVAIDGGIELDAWCIKPPDFDASKKYPVLFYVYGEPAGQTVLDRWGGTRHLWHTMLAHEGYVVMSVDNRGTPAPRGRDWRRCIYRQVGILASADQAAAVKAIQKRSPWMDPARVAVWGWSGGGSMSLNAIFRYPDIYQTAMAVASVPNQRLYDTIYQERYMGLPQDNVDGYRNGSPINFAHQLKGNLLIMHGTGDDNCHYLGAEHLINELILHNKSFTMMAYPDRAHGINEGKNTTRHVYETLTRYLTTNVDRTARSRIVSP